MIASAVLALAVVVVVPAVAGPEESRDYGRTTDPRFAAAVTETRLQEEGERARRETPEAREERRQSRSRFSGSSPAQSREIAESHFGAALHSDVWAPLALRPGERLVRYTGRHGALVERGDGLRTVAESDVPLQVSGDGGELGPVELALTERAGGLAPRESDRPTDDRNAGGSCGDVRHVTDLALADPGRR